MSARGTAYLGRIGAWAAAILWGILVAPARGDANGDSIVATATVVYQDAVVKMLDDAPAVIDTAANQIEYTVTRVGSFGTESAATDPVAVTVR